MPSFLALALFAPLTQRVLQRLRPAYQPLWALRHAVVAERISLRTFATFGEALRPCLTRCITAALRAVAFVPSLRRSRALLPSQAAQRPARPRWCTGAVRAARWPASGRAAARRAMAGTRARPALHAPLPAQGPPPSVSCGSRSTPSPSASRRFRTAEAADHQRASCAAAAMPGLVLCAPPGWRKKQLRRARGLGAAVAGWRRRAPLPAARSAA